MQIQYRTTGHKREVRDRIGAALVSARIADEVVAPVAYETRDVVADTADAPKVKRKYKRRDLRAED